MIHYKNSNGDEIWYEYDSNGNEIHYKTSDGFEVWYEYDSNGKFIHFKNSNGFESWREYDSDGNEIHFKNSNGVEYWCDSDGGKTNQKKRKGKMKMKTLEQQTAQANRRMRKFLNKTHDNLQEFFMQEKLTAGAERRLLEILATITFTIEATAVWFQTVSMQKWVEKQNNKNKKGKKYENNL